MPGIAGCFWLAKKPVGLYPGLISYSVNVKYSFNVGDHDELTVVDLPRPGCGLCKLSSIICPILLDCLLTSSLDADHEDTESEEYSNL